MKRIFLLPLLAIAIALGVSAQNSKTPDAGRRQYQVFGVAFYNLETSSTPSITMAHTTSNTPPQAQKNGTGKNIGQR